ncbi:GNAT family N-acetyltransferase [Clostridiaceae bacterium M8S5]|nr:GNAT family N-acetyltransferase [Clostridiaceae bacterium M8S5]
MNIITTDRLIVREFSLEDTEEVYKFSQEESLKKWMPDQVYEDIQVAKKVLEFLISKYTSNLENIDYPYVMGVELKDTKLIGHVGLSKIKEGIEIGYAIGEDYQRKGYASEVVKAFAKWSKENLNLPVLYGVVKSDNIASCKTLEKAGFTYQNEEEVYNRKIYTI